jgi:hypothetical protein
VEAQQTEQVVVPQRESPIVRPGRAANRCDTLASVTASNLALAFNIDLSGPMRSLSGHFALVDDVMRFAAVYVIFAAVLVVVSVWMRNARLRTSIAAAVAASWRSPPPPPSVRSSTGHGLS